MIVFGMAVVDLVCILVAPLVLLLLPALLFLLEFPLDLLLKKMNGYPLSLTQFRRGLNTYHW